VPSLSLPDPENLPTVEELGRYEGVKLFCERASAVASTFELSEENAPAVARLCHSLDGMPLAIELAAARTKVLSVEQILTRVEDSLKLLIGTDRTAHKRQRTLRGTLDWSYDLLSEAEHTVQFFASPEADITSFGEGKIFLGTKVVSTDGRASASFTFKPARKVGAGKLITATATDPDGNTSEFSAPKKVVAS
jgi:hypothetical protein